jgi:hypothetical protein
VCEYIYKGCALQKISLADRSLKFRNVAPNLNNVRRIAILCLSCRHTYKKTLYNQTDHRLSTLNRFVCTKSVRPYPRHESTKHPFPFQRIPAPVPNALSWSGAAPIAHGQESFPDSGLWSPCAHSAWLWEPHEIAREGLSHHAMLFTVISSWSQALCFRSLSSPVL